MRTPKPKLSYSSVTSTLALFIALGGTSWAVATLPKGSVDTRELANSAVTGKKIRNGSITHVEIKNGSLIGRKILPGGLSSRQIGHGSLNGGDIRNGSLDGRDVAVGSLHGEHVADGSLTGADLADGSIGTEKLRGLPGSLRPDGAAGGALTGSYPDPGIADGAIGLPQVADLLKDGAPDTPTLRSLGTGAGQAAAGDDARFPSAGEKAALAGTSGTPGGANPYVTDADARLTNARTPTGPAGGDLSGTYPNPALRGNSVGAAEVANGSLRIGDTAVFTGQATLNPGTLGARQCGTASANLGFDVQDGDILEVYGNEATNAPSVKYFGAMLDGDDDNLAFLVCELAGVADADYGGLVRFVVHRP